jgi:hypothetical protein
MHPLNARVWRRYGHLRIYVSADNDPVGWFDPRTGRSQLSQPDLHDEFWAAVRIECQRLLAEGQPLADRVNATRRWPGAGTGARGPPRGPPAPDGAGGSRRRATPTGRPLSMDASCSGISLLTWIRSSVPGDRYCS